MKDEFYYLGKITKLFGLKGELVFFMDVDDINEYNGLDGVFIEINGDKVPFLFDRFTIKSHNSAIVKLSDIKDMSQAQKMINKSLYLPKSTLPKLKGSNFYYHEVIGFIAIDSNEGEIGKIKEVIDQTAQALLVIDYNKKEFLFPIVDELIEKIDRKNKKLYIKIPEGLLEIYK